MVAETLTSRFTAHDLGQHGACPVAHVPVVSTVQTLVSVHSVSEEPSGERTASKVHTLRIRLSAICLLLRHSSFVTACRASDSSTDTDVWTRLQHVGVSESIDGDVDASSTRRRVLNTREDHQAR